MLKRVPVSEAVGRILGHDITRIVPGGFKGRAFKAGQIIRAEDIPLLLDLGKQSVYVYEPSPGELHEDEAARRLGCCLAGEGLSLTEPNQGRVDVISVQDGVLRIDVARVLDINRAGDVIVATLHPNVPVKKGQTVAGTRAIPLVVQEDVIKRVESLSSAPVMKVSPYLPFQVGVVTTGWEIWKGRIKDGSASVLQAKLAEYGSSILGQEIVPDDKEVIRDAIMGFVQRGADIVLVTGGMSVDPDDTTPGAIRETGAEIVAYGVPVLPGSMFLVSYLGQVPVLGLPGCVLHARTTVLDIFLPRILAGDRLTRYDLVSVGVGGLCRGCEVCTYPACSFGKNWWTGDCKQ